MLKGRWWEGMRHKAKRGAVLNHPPRGDVRGPEGDDQLAPDEPAQGVIRWLFDAFERQGSLHGWLRSLVAHDVRVPIRPHGGLNRGPLEWRRPTRLTWHNRLHQPISAGAYRWGSRQADPRRPQPGRRSTGRTVNAPEACAVLINDRFPASSSGERLAAIHQR
jgi:hypothetical protein